MSHTVRTIGDPKTISRRSFIAGSITAAISLIAATGFGGWVLSSFERAKQYIFSRQKGLYAEDSTAVYRVSSENPEIIAAYKNYLSPGYVIPASTELSHRLLHTVYGDAIPAHIEKLRATSVEDAVKETSEEMPALVAAYQKISGQA